MPISLMSGAALAKRCCLDVTDSRIVLGWGVIGHPHLLSDAAFAKRCQQHVGSLVSEREGDTGHAHFAHEWSCPCQEMPTACWFAG